MEHPRHAGRSLFLFFSRFSMARVARPLVYEAAALGRGGIKKGGNNAANTPLNTIFRDGDGGGGWHGHAINEKHLHVCGIRGPSQFRGSILRKNFERSDGLNNEGGRIETFPSGGALFRDIVDLGIYAEYVSRATPFSLFGSPSSTGLIIPT